MGDEDDRYVIPKELQESLLRLAESDGSWHYEFEQMTVRHDEHRPVLWYTLKGEELKQYKQLQKECEGTNREIVLSWDFEKQTMIWFTVPGIENKEPE
jgi:hypothetical protein